MVLPAHEYGLLAPLPFPINTMLELGNKANEHGTYKAYFQALGIEHTSVDINGQDGALPLDLRRPLGLGQFDAVTNFGTSEHVSEQAPCWRNIVEACKVGGVIASTTPLPGDWLKHGRWYPYCDFYTHLAGLNGFRIDRLFIACEMPKRLVCARLTRVEVRSFEMPRADLLFDNGNHGVIE